MCACTMSRKMSPVTAMTIFRATVVRSPLTCRAAEVVVDTLSMVATSGGCSVRGPPVAARERGRTGHLDGVYAARMTTSPVPGFHAVVPAGGAGTRLWPLSRRAHPKFLLDLTGSGRTLLQATWDRLVPLTGEGGVLVVTGEAHADAVREQLPALGEQGLVTEPSGRDSMAAIGLAAALLRERHGPDVVLGSFAADHVVRRPDDFHAAVREAVAAARAGYVVTVGVRADHPSTAFGYIEEGGPLDVAAAPTARHVARFVEKPDAETAAGYLATGRYRWNAGMFVVRAE